MKCPKTRHGKSQEQSHCGVMGGRSLTPCKGASLASPTVGITWEIFSQAARRHTSLALHIMTMD